MIRAGSAPRRSTPQVQDGAQKAPKGRKSPEQELHLDVAKFLRVALRRPVFWTTFPAGGGGKLRGAVLNGMGLVRGVPDILIFAPLTAVISAGHSLVLGIELKADAGRLSPEQIGTHADMMEAGVRCRVARSVDHVQDILLANGIPIHARIASPARPRSCGEIEIVK